MSNKSNNKPNVTDVSEKKQIPQRDSIIIEDVPNAKIADFETAITVAGTGKFQYLLILAIIPVSWASSIDTANMSMILAPAECDLGLSLFDKGLLNAGIYVVNPSLLKIVSILCNHSEAHELSVAMLLPLYTISMMTVLIDLNLDLWYNRKQTCAMITTCIILNKLSMVLSGFVWGFLADVKGRKKVILYGYMADGICNVFAGFSQNFETLLFFKFLSGLIVSGPYASLMAYCAEFYGASGRTKIPILVGFSVSFGNIFNAALAWLVVPQPWSIVLWDGAFVYNSWRIFLSLCGVSSLIGVVCISFFPESPKFLMTQNRNEDALEVFKTIYNMNTGLPKDNYPIRALSDVNLNSITAEQSKCDNSTKASLKNGIQQMKPIFLNPHLSRIILFVVIQFCMMLGLNTLRLWQPQLFATIDNFYSLDTNVTNPTFCEILDISTSINANRTVALEEISTCESILISDTMYIDTIIVSSTSSIFILAASVFVHFLQHKYLLFIDYGCSLLCLIALIWSTNTLTTLVLTCLYVGLLSKSFNILVGATVLLFPTSLRAMAVSTEMIIGRVGSMIGNFMFPVLLQYGCLAPIINLICFTLACMLLTCFIPSTSKHAV